MTDLVLLIFHEVSDKVSLSRKSIYARIKSGEFPRQVKIGKASRWLKHEVEAWILDAAAGRS